MKIIFTDHAKLKLDQRRIAKKLVIETLKSPDFVRPSYNNREVAYRNYGKNYLAVIFVRENGELAVITTHWVEKPKDRE